MQQYGNAALCNSEAFAIFKKISKGEDSIYIAKTRGARGDYYRATGRERRGIEEYQKALEIFRRLEPDNPEVQKIEFILYLYK